MSTVTTPAFLDVTVPMYAAGSPHPYQPACQWLMSQIAAGALDVAIDTEIVQEVLHRYGSLRRYAEAVRMANHLLTLIPHIIPVTQADMQVATALFQQHAPQGVPARDLIHAAVMQNHGLTHIISPDAHFDTIAGITRLDPLTLHLQAGQPTP